MLSCILAVVTSAVSALPSSPSLANAIPYEFPFTLTHLGLVLRVDYDRGTVSGTATLQVRNVTGHPADRVPLLLNRLMTVSRVEDSRGRPLRFLQQVVVFQDDSILQVNAILVSPRRSIAPGDTASVVVHFAGFLVGYTETGSLYIRDHVSRDFTILREDAYAFPGLGVPSWSANRAATREPFDFTAQITVPVGQVVAMGGEPDGHIEHDSMASWSYHSPTPVPFLNIAIAPYQVLESGSARIFFFPADSTGARTVERAVAGALDRFALWFGPLDRQPRLTVMEIPEGWGSQASLTAGIIQTADAFRDLGELRQLYHELSHLWNVPDLDRPSPRWNEGFATFLEWRMAAELDGWEQWDARIARSEQTVMQRCEAQPTCDAVPFASFGTAGLTDRSYPVGMLMFYLLYRVLGPEAFDRAYREFFQDNRAGGASSNDLMAAFARVDSRSKRVFADWFLTTRWYSRLAAGETVQQMVPGYLQP